LALRESKPFSQLEELRSVAHRLHAWNCGAPRRGPVLGAEDRAASSGKIAKRRSSGSLPM
jgi:hypothetical protein